MNKKICRDEYTKTVDRIFSYSSFGKTPSLERIKKITQHFGNPEKNMKFIHIAGTNGKGSTSTVIGDVLSASGYKTGVYTSPHLISFCERIAIDGKMISEEELYQIGNEVMDFADTLEDKPTAFDIITAIALLYFSNKKCEVAVLECGLGGKYDATNIVTPTLSIITSVSFDHKGILGNTLTQIAQEKAGIIKSGVPVISYPFEKSDFIFNPQQSEVQQVLIKTAKEKDSRLIVADPKEITSCLCNFNETILNIDGLNLTSKLVGEHQTANMLTAYTALRELRKIFAKISDTALLEGFSKAYIPARLEKVQDSPIVIIDGGHNRDCARALEKYLVCNFTKKRKVGVIGMMKDKECQEVLSIIAPHFDEIVITQPEGSRAKDVDELGKTAKMYNSHVTVNKNPLSAFSSALNKCGKNDVLVVFGSFYLAGEIKENFYTRQI